MNYSVTYVPERRCRIVRGVIPVYDMAALVKAWSADEDTDDPQFMDGPLSEHFNASFVCGPRSMLQAWRKELGLR